MNDIVSSLFTPIFMEPFQPIKCRSTFRHCENTIKDVRDALKNWIETTDCSNLSDFKSVFDKGDENEEGWK